MTSPLQHFALYASDLRTRRRTSVPSDQGSADTQSSEQKSTPQSTPPPASPEFNLLDDSDSDSDSESHEKVTAPLITRDAYDFPNSGLPDAIPQYGLLGSITSICNEDERELFDDRRLYLNTVRLMPPCLREVLMHPQNAPFSAVVCGVQGSGKSHTVGVMLESMLIPDEPLLGSLINPLAALVLHFGETGGAAKPCEAAFQCISKSTGTKPPKVRVFVSPSRLRTMNSLYRNEFGHRVEVLPLKFADNELDASAILAMMSVSNSHEPPLYVHLIMNILRELGEDFTYPLFRAKLFQKADTFNPQQKSGFQQRMSLLESFLGPRNNIPRFKNGEITIVDLTDPFIDAASACSLFEIITRIFERDDVEGKVLLVDEAHKVCIS
ncbi:hypothetical protein FRB99_007131 [Tulasnella sp. 403]|nr:hypothetical protein FRB99_007131 [Tulasnella sp. 403]